MAAAYDAVWALALAVHRGRMVHMDLKTNIEGVNFMGTAVSSDQ